MDWNSVGVIVGVISSLFTFVTFVHFLFKEVAAPFFAYRELHKSNFNLFGTWYSSWEPKALNEPAWVDEKITVLKGKFGKIIIKNENNSEGYSFTCVGKMYNTNGCKFLYGDWVSNSSEDDKCGRFLLTINPSGFMMGNFFGPNTEGVMMTGGWVLGHKLYHVESAKMLYGKGYLSEREILELKKIRKNTSS